VPGGRRLPGVLPVPAYAGRVRGRWSTRRPAGRGVPGRIAPGA